MTFSSYRVKVPGKLIIAGEYAILEQNQPAVVVAINRYITANIEGSQYNRIFLPQLGLTNVTWSLKDGQTQFNSNDPRLGFIKKSIEVANQFLCENSIPIQPIQLTIKSELDDAATGRKYGLGSSAAVVVAVISAILTINGKDQFQPSLEQIFKLSAIAHLLTQKNGSGIDIAASTFGGWLSYTSYQPEWVLNKLQQKNSLSELINMTWPNLSITPLQPPASLKLCVGWTGEPVKTASMVNRIMNIKNLVQYKYFLEESSVAVAQLIKSFEMNDTNGAISSLTKNRNALIKLSELANLSIETPILKQLADLAEKYGSGKPSGAGGGDCGIALIEKEESKIELQKAWGKCGIIPLKLSVSNQGASFTEYNCEMSLNEYQSLK